MIIIIADEFDVHADIVLEKITASFPRVFRLNLDVSSLLKTKITYKNGSWTIKKGYESVISSEVSTVWMRRSTVSLTSEQENDNSNGFRIWRSEWNRILFGFYNSLGDAFWLNHIRQATLSDNKFYQFSVATQCGLIVPKFITSNEKSDLIEFSNNADNLALKFMAQDLYKSMSGEALGLYVNKITLADLTDFSEESENPITLQEYIDKDFEVRYTYVDRKHLVCCISSQQSKKSSIDWRRYDIPNTPHFSIEPPIEIKEKIELLMDRLNLNFGAIDFIVDKSGQWWFLEVNSAGQWLWIEDLANLRISDSIAECLVRRSRNSRE